MNAAPRDWCPYFVSMGLLCIAVLAFAGCNDSVINSGVAHPGTAAGNSESDTTGAADSAVSRTDDAKPAEAVNPANAAPTSGTGGDTAATTADDPARPRTFAVEGPDHALRVNFDDLDLLKVLNMDPVTPDCVEQMPAWLKDLSGKKVRIRGFMKPGPLEENIPQFVLVRDQGLCCFGPKGKIYHLISTTLKKGTTTDYIELRPFDVLGTFRIGLLQLDDGTIFQLYYLDDAAIIQK
jgi:hypothetical protein